MSRVDDYYNNFYKELARIDEQGNNFSKIEKFLPELSPGAKILDIGCGHGSVSHELVKRGFEVYGMEINRDAIESLKVKGFRVVECDITEPFNLNEKFDLVLLLDVLEHVFDPLSLLGEAAKVLKDGGEIIVSVPLYFDLIDRLRILFTGSIISYDNLCYGREIYGRFRSYNYDHIRFFRPKDIFEMSETFGLSVKEALYFPFWEVGGFTRILRKILVNRYTMKRMPNLLAHSMVVRLRYA